MEYRKLGRTGLRVSAVSLGAWEIGGAAQITFPTLGAIPHGWGRADDNASLALIDRCRGAGVNFIDTAPIYGDGHSEEVIGRALRECRGQWIVCTKGGHGAAQGVAWTDFSRKRLLQQMDESLARLKMDAVDVYLLHNPSENDIARGECLEAMAEIRRQGKTRFTGVSIGPNAMGVDLIQRGLVDVLQQSISLVDPAAITELLPAAVAHDIGIVARGVFGAGFLTGAVKPDTAFDAEDRRSWQSMEDKRGLASLAEALRPFTSANRSLAQVAVQYALEAKGVATVIAGTAQWRHMEENIAALRCPALTADERRQIDALRKT